MKREWLAYVVCIVAVLLVGFSPWILDAFKRLDSGCSFKARYLFGLSDMANLIGREELGHDLYMQAWSIGHVEVCVFADDKAGIDRVTVAVLTAAEDVGTTYMYIEEENREPMGLSFSFQSQDAEFYKQAIRKAGGKLISSEEFWGATRDFPNGDPWAPW